MRIISMEKGDNVKSIFTRFSNATAAIEQVLKEFDFKCTELKKTIEGLSVITYHCISKLFGLCRGEIRYINDIKRHLDNLGLYV